MNPNAKEFVFRTTAQSFVPQGSALPTPPKVEGAVKYVPVSLSSKAPVPVSLPRAEPVQVVKVEPVAVVAEVPANNDAADAEEDGDEGDEEEIDETDPLWIATLKLTKGDRKEAIRMLEDPDALMQYPEIKMVMDAQESTDADGDWESSNNCSVEAITEQISNVNIVEVNKESSSASSASSSSSSAAAVVPAEEVVEEEEAQDGDPRSHLNIVFIGHVDAGKSTLSGSILYIMGKVDNRTIERFEREAKQRNRESWFLAFIMDTSEEERAKGKTVEVGRAQFETEINRYTILDAPGHKNYVPNMISGAAQADVGVLVISARRGEFETGFEKGGQTREHALLAKTLGVKMLVVVINKMDDPTVLWDLTRYEECVGKLKPYLKSCGYVIKTDVKFVPIAGITGDNVLKEVTAEKCPWWRAMYTSGQHNTTTPTLLSTLDAIEIKDRNADAPLRIPCLDRYLERGCVVMGKVESGTLRMDEEITIAPTRKRAKVEAIYVGETKVRSAKPGENVMIKFNINVEDIQKGYVLCSSISTCPSVCSIRVQLALVDMLEYRPIFSPGYDAVMHIHTVEIEVTCAELISVLDKGKHLKRPFARQGQMCMARLTLPMSTCMETFANNPSLGRLTLRDEGKTIAIGKVMELLH